MQTGGEPKRARQKHTLASRQTVDVFLSRPVTQNKTVLQKLAFDFCNRSANALVRCRQKAEQRQREQTGVERVRSVKLGERFFVDVVAALTNFVVNLRT